ncbi:MAG: hypothetical protein SVW77_02415 [Candidatus Nanohaloarchaea archaeon]|nr:hypothetical protein [Candidatus Nanohaloarchaea archaeon]
MGYGPAATTNRGVPDSCRSDARSGTDEYTMLLRDGEEPITVSREYEPEVVVVVYREENQEKEGVQTPHIMAATDSSRGGPTKLGEFIAAQPGKYRVHASWTTPSDEIETIDRTLQEFEDLFQGQLPIEGRQVDRRMPFSCAVFALDRNQLEQLAKSPTVDRLYSTLVANSSTRSPV